MIMRIPILKSILRNLDWFEEARRHHVAPDGSIFLGGTNHRLKKAGDWEESKHPRADDGKFTSGSGGGSKKPSKTKRKLERRAEAASQGRVSGAIQTLLSGGSALDKIGWLNTSKPKEPEKKPESKPQQPEKPKAKEKPKEEKKPKAKLTPVPKKFSDANKDVEIGLTGTSNDNAMTRPTFEINITRPISAKAKFYADQISTKQGKAGINFSRYSEIGKILGKGKQDVFLTLPPEAITHIREEDKRIIQELKDDAAKVQVKTWRWTDDGMPVYHPKEVGTEFRPDLQDMKAKIERYHTQIWQAMLNSSKRVPSAGGYRWYEIPHEKLKEIISAAEGEQAARDKAYADKRAAREAKAFDQARVTGEKSEIRRWSSPCDSEHEECSTDIVVEYAHPDGTKSKKRFHTY